MTENEAINELYEIQNQFERSVLEAECNDEYAKEALRDNKRAVKSIKMAVSALKEIQKYRAIGNAEECREAVEKQKPKHVNIKDWSPARCPFCNYELSTSLGDGYYQHPTFLERCPKCGQAIRWDNNLEGMEYES